MKKILILAYDFPPYNSIGAQRPYSWFKYFKEFGWEPVVVTRHWDADIMNGIDYIKPSKTQKTEIEESDYGTIIRARFRPNLRDKMLLKFGFDKLKVIRKALTLFYKFTEFYVPTFDNRKNIFKAANQFLMTHKVDVIIATGEPFILFKYASELSKKHQTPWVADYRDGWSTNYNRGHFERWFYQKIEKNLIESTSFITTVSKPLKKEIQKFSINGLIEIIMNGFEQVNNGTEAKNNVFTITYAGTIYPYQRLEIFLQGLKDFLALNEPLVKCNFFGLQFFEEQVNRLFSFDNSLIKYFNVTKRLPHEEIQNKLVSSDILLVLANENIDGSCAKIYDYLAAQRKIFCVVNDHGTLEEIILNTQSGVLCESAKNVSEKLLKAYNEWQQMGQVACHSKNIEQYSRKEQTKKLAQLLNELI